MDIATMEQLNKLNNDFYRVACASFSQSRQRAWPGWHRIAPVIEALVPHERVVDVACGNLRFERFLCTELPDEVFEFTCLDSCAELASENVSASFFECDVVQALIGDEPINGLEEAAFDVAVSFGFMHHVPAQDNRCAFAKRLLSAVRPGGLVALSFWQFMSEASLAEKALETTRDGCAQLGLALDAHDYLLGWNGEPGLYRYCHSFTSREIDEIAESCSAEADVVDRFNADGRTESLNHYVIFQRRSV